MVTDVVHLPPGKRVHFYRAEGSAFPTLVDYLLTFAHSRSGTIGSVRLYPRKSSYEHEHALGETRTYSLILVGTRFTYYKVTPSGKP